MAVLALALITASIVAAYSSTSAEVVSNNAMRAQQRAYQHAEVGLQQFLQRRGDPGFCTNCVPDPALADSEWTRVTLPGGYATVVATRIRPAQNDGSPALFLVRSTGVDTAIRLSGAGNSVFATRTVGQYATYGTSSVKPLAAWTSLNGFQNNNSSTRIPVLGTSACSFAAIAAVVVPDNGFYGGPGPNPLGLPPVDSSMTRDSIKNVVGIDWKSIINDNALPADVTIPPDGNWPSFADPNYWPTIRIKKNYTVPSDGRGIIIADSNLTFANDETWEGIVLVGGTLTATGTGTLNGVFVSGLNHMLPTGGPASRDVMANTKRLHWNPCDAISASGRFRTYFVWSNTWLDNIATW